MEAAAAVTGHEYDYTPSRWETPRHNSLNVE